jgi:hypothetical protein
MVDALVYGTGRLQVEVQVGAWLMHLFMVQADYRLVQVGAWLMHKLLVKVGAFALMVHVDYMLIGIGLQ